MLKALRFCAGAVGKKEYVSGMTHFTVQDSRIRAYNGTISICSPIEFDITCNPKALSLIKAVVSCTDTVKLTLTPAGRLSVKSGAFKALIDCIPEPAPQVDPEGVVIPIDGELFMKGIKAVAPFIGSDASRLWSHGILVKDKSLFATNNIICVQYWLGIDFPNAVNIPHGAVKELLRIGEIPTSVQVAESSITFHFEGDRWLRSQLYDTTWPNLYPILDQPVEQDPIDEELFKGLDIVKPFVDKLGSIYFKEGKITTHLEGDEGAEFILSEQFKEGRFNIDMLQLIDGSVDTIGWHNYPGPCPFRKGNLRGVIIGMRL